MFYIDSYENLLFIEDENKIFYYKTLTVNDGWKKTSNTPNYFKRIDNDFYYEKLTTIDLLLFHDYIKDFYDNKS